MINDRDIKQIVHPVATLPRPEDAEEEALSVSLESVPLKS